MYEEAALVHNTPKRTPLHEQTHEQKQTHTTWHTTILNQVGEKIETSR
jgi:hypothetical protein